MTHTLTPLPYDEGALEPAMSRTTLDYHHNKHHAGYVNNLNKLIKETEYVDSSLEKIIKESQGPIFNNSAQVWNHIFYFDQFAAKPQQAPTGALLEAIEYSFGSFGGFKEQFSQSALSLFGSGWVWLIKEGVNELAISPMGNAATPLKEGREAILTCDMWEHAYYIDHFNNKANYLINFWELIDWRVIEERFNR